MKYDLILIRYGELTTKGKNRKKFITFLRENISVKLKKFSHLKYESTRDRMYIFLNGENQTDVMNALEEVFGIHKFDLAVRTVTDLQSMKEHVLEAAKEALKNGKAPVQDQTVELGSVETRMGKKTIELHHISKSYGEKKILEDFSYIVLKNQRLGIIGPNGCGKSTLIKMIAGLVEPDAGYIEIGETIKIGYFAQEEQHMDDSQRVIDYIKDVAEYVPTSDGRITASQMLDEAVSRAESGAVYSDKGLSALQEEAEALRQFSSFSWDGSKLLLDGVFAGHRLMPKRNADPFDKEYVKSRRDGSFRPGYAFPDPSRPADQCGLHINFGGHHHRGGNSGWCFVRPSGRCR